MTIGRIEIYKGTVVERIGLNLVSKTKLGLELGLSFQNYIFREIFKKKFIFVNSLKPRMVFVIYIFMKKTYLFCEKYIVFLKEYDKNTPQSGLIIYHFF